MTARQAQLDIAALAAAFPVEYHMEREDALFQSLLAFVLAVVETLAVYLILSLSYRTPPLTGFLGQVPDSAVPWFAAVMLSRGLLQPLNFCLFAFGINTLVFRLWNLRREFRAFQHPFFAGIGISRQVQAMIGEESRHLPLENVKRIIQEYSGALPLLVRRIEAGSRRLADEGDANQVHAVMQAVAEIDREALDGRYTLLRYLIWLIPTIGFLGTVMGIGRAIAGFTGLLAQVGRGGEEFQAQLQPVLGMVARELGVAFDTTVLALLLNAIIVALTSITQSREEGLLSSVDEFCLRHFVSRIAVPDFGTKQMAEMLQQAVVAVGQAIVSRRGGAADEESGVSARDLAGMITAQSEQNREILTALQRSVEKLATSAEKLTKLIEAKPKWS